MTSTDNENSSVVLVHGAYADGSSWWEVITRSQGAGITASAVQNPLTSLADDVTHTRGVLGLTIETKNENPSLSQLDTWAAEASLLLALGVNGLTVGLVRAETASHLSILAAAGATSRTRRGPRPARRADRHRRGLPGRGRLLPESAH